MIPAQHTGQADVVVVCFPADVAVVSYVKGQVLLSYDVVISRTVVDLMSVEVCFGGL